MAHKFVLDTHALVRYLEGNPRLGTGAKAVLDNETSELVLPIIALAEAAFHDERGRTSIPGAELVLRRVEADPRIAIHPLSTRVLQRTLSLLSIPEMHDRFIVATALDVQTSGHSVSLLTKDALIVASNLVPVIW